MQQTLQVTVLTVRRLAIWIRSKGLSLFNVWGMRRRISGSRTPGAVERGRGRRRGAVGRCRCRCSSGKWSSCRRSGNCSRRSCHRSRIRGAPVQKVVASWAVLKAWALVLGAAGFLYREVVVSHCRSGGGYLRDRLQISVAGPVMRDVHRCFP